MTILQRSIEHFPDLLSLHRNYPDRYPFLLESVSRNSPAEGLSQKKTHHARWDILFAFPGKQLTLSASGDLHYDADAIVDTSCTFLEQLDNWWQEDSVAADEGFNLPFYGGWFLYLAYELAGQIEPTLRLPRSVKNNSQRPQAMAVRCPAAILRDHDNQRIILVAEAKANGNEYLDVMTRDIQAVIEKNNTASVRNQSPVPIVDTFQEEPEEQFLAAIARVKAYIKEGDVFQVNLSRRWSGTVMDNIAAADIYQCLRQHNPAPFAGLCVFQDWALISSSPERLVRIDTQRCIETRPIAGTHPRGDKKSDDQRLSQALLQHPKERAEHIMLIDMERNDLGRVCRPGSIEVNELMALESYSHVHHIVSNIRGALRDNVTPGEAIRAVFPGGTITGCPKIRCMEIIAELEQAERGPYTGSMGYLNRDGSLDLNILIRSLTLDGNELNLRAGAGIVADSIPERELAETRAKARGVLLALGIEQNKTR